MFNSILTFFNLILLSLKLIIITKWKRKLVIKVWKKSRRLILRQNKAERINLKNKMKLLYLQVKMKVNKVFLMKTTLILTKDQVKAQDLKVKTMKKPFKNRSFKSFKIIIKIFICFMGINKLNYIERLKLFHYINFLI